MRFPLSTPYFIFCFRFFSILTASFRLFLKVYSVYLCRQLLFFFFFFFVCLSLLPFVFLTCFFGGRSLPKTVHKLSVLYDKKNLFFSPFITSSRKFHSPFFHVHVLPFNYNFIEIFFPPPFTIIHYSLAIFIILCSKWVFFHYHIIIFLTAFCHFPLSPLQCPDLPWPNLLSLASSSITLIFLFLDLINIRPIGYP